jgi:hypothetical protein
LKPGFPLFKNSPGPRENCPITNTLPGLLLTGTPGRIETLQPQRENKEISLLFQLKFAVGEGLLPRNVPLRHGLL